MKDVQSRAGTRQSSHCLTQTCKASVAVATEEYLPVTKPVLEALAFLFGHCVGLLVTLYECVPTALEIPLGGYSFNLTP